jgi:cation diffusion facilitator CzcD-associated flavoprotein CzcO
VAEQYHTLIIGAGPAGLAVAACLIQRGLRPLVIEKADQVGASWRAHYERLHLHTVKKLSALPGRDFPREAPRYVSRQGVVDYLDAYAKQHGIAPRFGETVLAIASTTGGWITRCVTGRECVARHVVLATGANNVPNMPAFPDQSRFGGRMLHSRDYRNSAPFAGQKVLVVGMGNTGAEIALDLAEHGVQASLSVRSPINLVYRDVLGRPSQVTSILLSKLPTAWGDALAKLLCTLTVGDLSRWGLHTADISPLRQLRVQGKTPVIDVGTLQRIRRGEIKVHPGIAAFTTQGLRFADGSENAFDSVIMATGYEAGLERLFPEQTLPLDASGLPREVVGQGPLAGVYFVGFDTHQPGGLLRSIAAQARLVARVIAG